jgi:hypothetical protein
MSGVVQIHGGDLSQPSAVIKRLEEIEQDLALRQNLLEAAAMRWFQIKRDQEHTYAIEFMKATGTVAERTAEAKKLTALIGGEEEAEYEALKAVVRVLDTRASIGMALLKSQGRS